MVAKPILQLPAITPPLTGNEQVPLVQGGATKRASVNDFGVALQPFFPSTSTAFTGQNSINGGGTLAVGGTFQLVNDTASPGATQYYGTNGAGTKGWYTLVAGGTVTSIDTGAGLTGGPITVSGTISLATVSGVAGTYGSSGAIPVVTVDAYGRVSAATEVAGNFVPTTRAINTSGGLQGGGALSSDLTLSITPTISGGTFGSGSSVPVLTFNERGQLTAAATAPISISGLNGLSDPGSNGVVVRTTSNTTVARTITGTGNINVANGDGVAANPTITFSGILPLANGGTNVALTAENGGIVYSTTSALAVTASAATAVLVTNSSGVPSLRSGPVANRVLRTDGTTIDFNYVFLTTDVSGILGGPNGGTGSQYFSVSSNLTAIRNYVFPNSSGTVALLEQAQTFTGPQRGTVPTITASGIDIIPNFGATNNFFITVSGAMRLQNPTGVASGQSGVIEFQTVSGGTATVTVSGTSWFFANGIKPTISAGSGVVNALAYYVGTSTTRIIGALQQNVSN